MRRDFLQAFLIRKTPPKTAAVWTAQQLVHGSHDYTRAASEGHPVACALLNVEPRSPGYGATPPDGLLSLLDGVSDNRAQVITLGLILAAAEAATGVHSWRNPTRATAAYLHFLAGHGYTPVGGRAARLRTPAPARRRQRRRYGATQLPQGAGAMPAPPPFLIEHRADTREACRPYRDDKFKAPAGQSKSARCPAL